MKENASEIDRISIFKVPGVLINWLSQFHRNSILACKMCISHFVKFISSHIVITCQELSLWNFQKHSMSNSCIQPLLLLQTPPPPQVTSSILIGYLWESWSQVIWRTTSNRNLSRKFQVLCCVINKGMLSTCFLLFTYFKSEVFYSSLSCGS